MGSLINEAGSALGFNDITGQEAAAEAAQAAAGVQAQASLSGIDEQRRQFDISQEQAAPFRGAGVSALEQQRILLGLGGNEQLDPNAARRAGLEERIAALQGGGAGLRGGETGQITSFTGANGKTEFFNQESNQGSNQESNQQLSELQAQLSAIPQFTAEDRGTAQDQQARAFDQLADSPGQRFIRDRQERALLRNASATGGLGGGNVQTALQQQAVGFAQQDIQNQFGRLGQLAGQGQAVTTNQAQLGGQTASNISNLLGQEGAARASGILAPAQANAAVTNQALQLGGVALGAYLGAP